MPTRRYAEDETIDRLRDSLGLREQILLGEALLNKALGVFEDGEPDAAIALVDEVVARFRRAEHPELKREVAVALQRKAAFLRGSGREDEAIAPYDEIIARFGGDPAAEDAIIQFIVADAYFCKGYSFHRQGRRREAMIEYIAAREYADRSTDPQTRALSAEILVNLALCHVGTGDTRGALLYVNEFEIRFPEVDAEAVEDQRAKMSEIRREIARLGK